MKMYTYNFVTIDLMDVHLILKNYLKSVILTYVYRYIWNSIINLNKILTKQAALFCPVFLAVYFSYVSTEFVSERKNFRLYI